MKSIQLISLLVLLVFCVNTYAVICQDGIPETAPDSAFLDHNNGLITDVRTGLVWRKCTEGQSGEACSEGERGDSRFTWKEALQHVKAVNVNSSDAYSDWRLPNKKELESIIENSCVAPSINTNFFYIFPSRSFYADANYWTSTTVAGDPAAAWIALFQYGAVAQGKKSDKFFIRLVRGGL